MESILATSLCIPSWPWYNFVLFPCDFFRLSCWTFMSFLLGDSCLLRQRLLAERKHTPKKQKQNKVVQSLVNDMDMPILIFKLCFSWHSFLFFFSSTLFDIFYGKQNQMWSTEILPISFSVIFTKLERGEQNLKIKVCLIETSLAKIQETDEQKINWPQPGTLQFHT